jgi:hypothetical protein
MINTTEIANRTTVSELVAIYHQNRERLQNLYALREQIEATETLSLHIECHAKGEGSRHLCNLEDALKSLERGTWGELVRKMELRRFLSVKRSEELDKQLRTGEGFPEITEENILAMMQGTIARAGEYLEEAVKEVYDFLRPWRWGSDDYKTNEKNRWQLGPKAIREGWVSIGYGRRSFGPNYYRTDHYRALNNVFCLLDGKTHGSATYNGELYDAVHNADDDGRGETEYFRFKCFKNGNLHLEFKRLDLVEKLNAIAGGLQLKYDQAA